VRRSGTLKKATSTNLSTRLKLLNESISRHFTRLKVVEKLELTRNNGKELSSTLKEETTVVGNKKKCTLVLVGSRDKRVDRLKIKEVGRLIHDKKVGADEGDVSEHDT